MSWNEAQKRYAHSEKGLAARKRYFSSLKGKTTKERYMAKRKAKLQELKKQKAITEDLTVTEPKEEEIQKNDKKVIK